MGSPGSPAYAICLCMFYEHKFNQSLYGCTWVTGCRTSAMIRAVRYIDDVLAIVAWDASVPSSKAYAKAITSCLAVAYHENMDLKEEAITHEIPFLQGKVVLDNARCMSSTTTRTFPAY